MPQTSSNLARKQRPRPKRSWFTRWKRRVLPRVGMAAISVFSYLPLATSQRIGRGVGYFLGYVPNKHRKISQINIEACFPAMAASDKKRLVKQSLQESGTLFMEMGLVWNWPVDRLLRQIRQVHGEHLLEKFRHGKVVALSPHLGNWELMAIYLSSIREMTIMYKPSKDPQFDQFIHAARSRFGHKLVPADGSGVRAMFKTLKQGGNVAILPDQEPKSGSGVFAPFYRQHARTLTLVSRLASNEGVSIIFCAAKRLGPGKGFDIHLVEADRQALAAKDPVAAATAMNENIEELIEIAPAQYQWMYKRFQTQPNGAISIYKK